MWSCREEASGNGLAGRGKDFGSDSGEWEATAVKVSVEKCQVLTGTFTQLFWLLDGKQLRRGSGRRKARSQGGCSAILCETDVPGGQWGQADGSTHSVTVELTGRHVLDVERE